MKLSPKNILVPTDFSPGSRRALSIANELGVAFNAEIHLLHVRFVVDDPMIDTEILDEVERILAVSEKETRQALGNGVENGRARIHAHIRRGPVPADVIIETVSEFCCDLVIMGTHGRRGLRRFLVGSVANEVVHCSPIPVLTTRAETFAAAPPQKLLVAIDSSEQSLQGVRVAAAWARHLRAHITVLHVVEPFVYPGFYANFVDCEVYGERLISRCTEELDCIAEEHLYDVPHETAVIRGHVALGIAAYAEENKFDMVVIATRGLSGITHTLVGSVAERVIQLSKIPVLTVCEQSSAPPE